MKKIVFGVFVLLIIGYALVQNGGRIVLIALSQHRLASFFPSTTTVNASSGNPPSYKNGTYTGSIADAFYGNIQVQITIANGKISTVRFLQHPSDALRSVAINELAMPNLTQEAVQAQSATVAIVTGATDTSQAFMQSLQSALQQAKS